MLYFLLMEARTLYRALALSLLLAIPLFIYLSPGGAAWFFGGFFFLAPLWLPPFLFALFAPLWLTYVRSQYVASIPYIILELKPGEHTPKTARAMELVFYSLYHRVNISRKTELLTGQIRLPWSFEIAAERGTVRFFVRIPRAHRQALELRLRTEYRDIDIDEPRDYAREVGFNPAAMRLAVREYTLTKPDPYPLKTYEVYEANAKKTSSPFDELLKRLVEFGEGERLFISIIIRPHQRAREKIWQAERHTLQEAAAIEIARIVGPAGDPRLLPKETQGVVTAIENALKKPSFDCGIRAIYLAERGAFSEVKANKLDELFNGFNDAELNGFVAIDPKTRLMWPLSDIFAALPWVADSYLFRLFRRRAYFAPPYYGKPFVLNTAELATIFHLPYVSRASALSRSRGARLEPPEDLPV